MDLKRLQQPESAPLPQRSTQQPQQHTPPSVEIGVAKSGEPSIVACPELVHAIHSAGVPDSGSQVTLNIDLASLATEKVLLRAAQANAAIQLGEASVGCELCLGKCMCTFISPSILSKKSPSPSA